MAEPITTEFFSHDKQFPDDGYYITQYEDGYRIHWYDGVEGHDTPNDEVYATRAEALQGIIEDWANTGNYKADLIAVREALATA